MSFLKGDFRLLLIDFLFIVENTAHIALILHAISLAQPLYLLRVCFLVVRMRRLCRLYRIYRATTFHVGVDGRRGPINRR